MGSEGDEELKTGPWRPHILIVALAGFGHHFQFLQLLHLFKRYQGVSVTFVSNAARCKELATLQAEGALDGVDLTLEPLFVKPALYPQDPEFPWRIALIAEKGAEEFEPFAQKLVELKKKGLHGVPTCVMSDMCLCFPQEVASQLGVPWYSVYVASPPYSALSCLEFSRLYEEKLHPYRSPRKHEMFDIPGATFARVRDSPHENVDFPKYWLDHSEKMCRATGLVYNSAEELDAPAGALEAVRAKTELRAKAANRKGPKIFAIGPILNFPGFTGGPSAKSTIMEGTSLAALEFLSTHPPSSVLYVCFGSVGNICPESLTELAHGLEASGVPFLWALKLSESLAGAALPPGFEERTKGRGYVEYGWAPQAPILLHPSTGGFLSHCGWNSILESLCAGVPVVTWPVAGDQPLNARFIENVSKCGLPVKKNYMPGDERRLKPSREDVSSSIRLLMVEEEGKKLRKNAQEWKTVLTTAVAEGGSSYKALEELMDEIFVGPSGKTTK